MTACSLLIGHVTSCSSLIGWRRFVHEMGDGVFGKVYRGELGGIVGGVTSLVAVKTLKPGANQVRKIFH